MNKISYKRDGCANLYMWALLYLICPLGQSKSVEKSRGEEVVALTNYVVFLHNFKKLLEPLNWQEPRYIQYICYFVLITDKSSNWKF